MDIDVLSKIFLDRLNSSSVRKISSEWNLQDELENLKNELISISCKRFQDSNKVSKMLRGILYDTEDVLDKFSIHSLKSQSQNHHKKELQVRQFLFKINAFFFRVKMVYEINKLIKRLHQIVMYGKSINDLGYGGFETYSLHQPPLSSASAVPMTASFASPACMIQDDAEFDSDCLHHPPLSSASAVPMTASFASPAYMIQDDAEFDTDWLHHPPLFSSCCVPMRASFAPPAYVIQDDAEFSPHSPRPYARHMCVSDTFKIRILQKRDVIGRESDKERIVEVLMQWRNEGVLSVLPIFGVRGIGKSTLVKYVYNDERIVKHFEIRIWVNVSPNFSVRRVVERIIRSAYGNRTMMFRNCEMDELRNMVREILREKVYLLVLDDVRNVDEGKWNELREFLVVSANGSKVVVTTCDESVVSVVGTMPVYCVKELANEDCLSLFLKSAFEGKEEEHPNVVRIGVDIVQKCEGIPLSVILLGSSLHKSSRHKWEKVRDHSVWDSQQNGNMLPVLKVSFENLPSYLKACLAYCSIFPKGSEIEIDKLIQLWMAQGLIHTSTSYKELEDIGLDYVDELLFRSFFQDIEENGPLFTSTCKMNDLVHDFVKSVAGSEYSIVCSHTQNISEDVKHLAFSDYDMSGKKLPLSLQRQALRTIFFPAHEDGPTNTSFVDNCISMFMHLRTLDLSDFCFEVLPSSIGKLKFLRYLDLSANGSIRTLPNSISKLNCLLTLRVALCTQLEELPEDTKDLISLRHLYLTTKQESFPENGVGCLSSLCSLSLYSCKSLVSLSDELKCLGNLRTLTIVDCPKLTFLPSSMKYLTALKNLCIIDCDELTLFEWQDIEGLKMLRSLVIGGLPQLDSKDVQRLENLQSLVIGGLPQLDVLPRWLEGSAHTLQYLRIERCPNFLALPEWLKNLTALEKIEISECPRLTSLPEGMSCLVELKELKIDNCPELSRQCGDRDRAKVAHIKETYLDGILVQNIENE
ncbi:hypothetical protein ACH5RR_007307 [Cinchona calisaya]|uniref:NB-ARC domain-containing protein n=1 Tax=Cinchona calisaya TaxID=153742 RepID=A0ABD3ARK1_9GENT